MDTITAWRSLNSRDCSTLEEYTKKFWDALLPIASFRSVPLVEQVETFYCELPKELRDYCIKKRVESMTQMVEIAQTGYALLTEQMSGFKSSTTSGKKTVKEDEPLAKVDSKPTQLKGKVQIRGNHGQQSVFYLWRGWPSV